MKHPKLRIAWSVMCGIACVLLVVLWVRSYSWMDRFDGSLIDHGVQLVSLDGDLSFKVSDLPSAWQRLSLPSKDLHELPGSWRIVPLPPSFSAMGVSFGDVAFGDWQLVLPNFYLVLLFGAVATLPWLHQPRWRFSLRTLLIAITLIAVVLGAAVYFTKAPTTPPIDVGDFGREVD